MTGWQMLWRVELPLSVPLVMAGIRTSALFVISTTTIAALTGYSDSLGEIVTNEASYHLSGVLGAAICIAVMAMVIELLARLGAAGDDARCTAAGGSRADSRTSSFPSSP